MEQRLSLVTLGAESVGRARAFYERLGWRASPASGGDAVAFFQLNGMALSLFSRAALAADAKVPDSDPGFSGITPARNCRGEAEVDTLFDGAVAAGARPLKRPATVFRGGGSGSFADPGGHLWEVVFNPHVPLDAAGNLHRPE